MADMEKKRGRQNYKNLDNEKSFSDETISIFVSISEEMENSGHKL